MSNPPLTPSKATPRNIASFSAAVLGFPKRFSGTSRDSGNSQYCATGSGRRTDQRSRRGVYGPFRPLLHRPPLLRAVAKVGETLRYEGTLDAALREWTICVVARELSNAFRVGMHLPLAAAAGVPKAALATLETRSRHQAICAVTSRSPVPLFTNSSGSTG